MKDEYQEPKRQSANPQLDFSWIENISLSTIIRLLVEKGILTPNDIIDKERKLRLAAKTQYRKSAKHSSHHHSSPIKKIACKYRWSRHLTAKLFGWHWKKNKSHVEITDDPY